MRRLSLSVALAALALGSVAATSDAGGDRVYFHCETSGVNTNLEQSAGSWSPDAPSGSMGSGGGGCFAFDTSLDETPSEEAADLVFEGTYSGAIEALVIHMYAGSTSVGAQSGGAGIEAEIRIEVDGRIVFYNGFDNDTYMPLGQVGDGPFPGTHAYEATIANLTVPDGDHDIRIWMSTPYLNVPTFWMYGGSDAAAGLTFNPDGFYGAVSSA